MGTEIQNFAWDFSGLYDISDAHDQINNLNGNLNIIHMVTPKVRCVAVKCEYWFINSEIKFYPSLCNLARRIYATKMIIIGGTIVYKGIKAKMLLGNAGETICACTFHS